MSLRENIDNTNDENPEDFYDCYVRYIKEGKQCMLELLSRGEDRKDMEREYQPLSRSQLTKVLKRMESDKRKEFEERIRAGYSHVRKTYGRKFRDAIKRIMNKRLAN